MATDDIVNFSRNKILIYQDVNLSFTEDANDLSITNITAINSKILNVLTTVIGERYKEPTFGSLLPELIFEPCDAVTAWQIETAIFNALMQWLGQDIQLDFSNTQVLADTDNQQFLCTVAYVILKNQVQGSLNARFAPDNQQGTFVS